MASVDDEQRSDRRKGLIYCVLFGVFLGIQVNIAKELSLTYNASYIIFIRSVSFLAVMPFVEWDQVDNCKGMDLFLYILISLLGFGAFATMVFSLGFIGAGDSNAIEFGSGLILTGVIGHFVLKERISCLYFMMLVLNSAGVILVARPNLIFGADEDPNNAATPREIGAVFAFLGASFGSLWPITGRKLASRENLHCFISTIMHGWIGVLLAGVWCTVDSSWVIPGTWFDVVLFISYGLASTFQMITGIRILLYTVAVDLAVATTISVVITYLAQVTFFGEEVNFICVTGTVIVTSCFILSAFWDHLGVIWQKHFGSEQRADIITEEEMADLVTNEE